ncbi:MAG TPA: methyltransferase domain-containing protein [Gammaproteobacteria bacterium]|nr:methyltransferase domain-containing protein [Gammaproteobacteria bacterium]
MAARPPLSRDELVRKCRELGPWFHQIDLGMGVRTRDVAPTVGVQDHDHPLSRWNKVRDALPTDMSGMRVLDVGCSDGFFSIEMARRGAREIIAIDGHKDCIRRLNWVKDLLELPAIKPYHCGIDSLHRILLDEKGAPYPMDRRGRPYHLTSDGEMVPVDDFGISLTLGTRIKRRLHIGGRPSRRDAHLGRFDFVLMFAVLYHLKDPLAGLEMVSRFSDALYIETIVVNDEEHSHLACIPPRPGVTTERKWYPTIRCLKDMLAWAGFQQVTQLAPATDHRPIYLARK